jgi:ribosomal protein S18 acetylase RimI-like enzyme
VDITDLPVDRADEAVALWHETGLTRPWNDPHADLIRAVGAPCSTVLAAVDDGVLTGTAMVGHDGHRGWVYYLAVRAERRRAGLGRDLMNASERWLMQRNVPKINLMVRTANVAVVAFYESLGYEDGEVLVLGKFLDR